MAKKVDSYGRDIRIMSEENENGEITTDAVIDGKGDLDTVEDRDLMVQAIRHRLITRQGELAPLGHPNYGSLLEEIIGEPNIPDTHRIIETLVRDCLEKEPRIRNIEKIIAYASPKDPSLVFISLQVELAKTKEKLKIKYPLYLEE